uniref:Uncharacterized protein n=1 Tax=Schistosoma curassoni TaxID=6186 RepID=A0A183KL28_9TREM
MLRCDLFDWYINSVCLKIMIHIAETETGVLDLTGWANRKAGPIRVWAVRTCFTRPWSDR